MSFLLAEDEWSRVIQEMGPLFGGLFIILRIGISVTIGIKALQALLKNKNALPLLLAATACLAILQGQIAPPTMLGFTVLSGGLALAAMNESEEEEVDDEESEDFEEEIIPLIERRRG